MTKKDEAAQQAAEAEAAKAAEAGAADPSLGVEGSGEDEAEAAPSGEEVPEEDVDEYPLTTVTPEMLEGGDWQQYRPSLTFKAKVMPERFSVEAKEGLVTGEAGDVLAVVEDDLYVFSASVFAAEYQPVVHGA